MRVSFGSNTTAGAVLFFLLLPSPEAIIPCVTMLGYHAGDSRYKSGRDFAGGGKWVAHI